MKIDLAFLALTAAERAATDVDIYLIAGQSNGSGNSAIKSAKPGTRDENRYENVRYCARRRCTDGSYRFYQEYFEPVHEGLGARDSDIGPELGMARVLDPLYDAPDRKALIVKVAAGGTSLIRHTAVDPRCDDAGDDRRFRVNGSWYPLPVEGDYWQPTGFLLRELKDYVTRIYRFLQPMGFRSLRFRALCWMQGETDRRFPDDYAALFPALCAEVRTFLTGLIGEDQSRLPVVAGEISETFSSVSKEQVAINRAFNAMLHGLEQTVPALTVIPTGGLRLNVAGESGEDVPVGTDGCHWNYNDMLAAGELFGKTAYEASH